MSILVVCRKCRAQFKVSDKFAGKSGPCPKCKTTIRVPTKAEEVKVHAPEDFDRGGRGVAGALSLKPIARRQARLQPVAVVAVAAAVLGALLVAWIAGELFSTSQIARAVGLLVVSPPLVIAGYSFLRDDDALEPYRGKWLYLRAGICAVVYTVLWGVFGYVAQFALSGQLWDWLFVAPPFLVVGAMVALGCFDLDFGSGFFHYSFYILVTMVLRWAAGMGWLWEISANA